MWNDYCELEDIKNEKVSVTTTVQILVFHVPDFCNVSKKGLGYCSTQASEAVHIDFLKTWEQYKLQPTNPKYAQALFDAMIWYNLKHM